MEVQRLIDSLARFRDVLPALVKGIADTDVRWRPASGNWSILEVVGHLADEEVEDFRTRLRLTLEDPTRPWPPIDPEGAAVQRKYNEASLPEVVGRFVTERDTSVAFLRSLRAPDWSQAYEHPKLGPIQAGEVLAGWVAHDHLHTRQIAKRLFEIAARDASPYETRYAGQWTD